jgi:hypothetical protein
MGRLDLTVAGVCGGGFGGREAGSGATQLHGDAGEVLGWCGAQE